MAEIAIHAVRPDSLPYEPVVIGPVLTSSEARIYTPRPDSTFKPVDVTDVVRSFDSEVYAFTAVMLLLLLCMMASLTLLRRKRKGVRRLLNIVWRLVQEMINLIVDQELFAPCAWRIRFAWLSLNILVLVLIFGYLMNLMSTDQVAFVTPDVIDRLDDLEHDRWRQENVTPWIAKNLMFHSALRQARNVSTEGASLIKLQKRQDTVFADMSEIFNPATISTFAYSVKQAIESRRIALVITDFLWTKIISLIGCRVEPKTLRLLEPSKESFANGILTTFSSKAFYTNFPMVNAYYEQRMRIAIEGAIVNEALQPALELILSRLLTPLEGQAVLQCLAKYKEPTEQNVANIQLTVVGLQTVFDIIGLSLSLASSFLVVEVTAHHAKRQIRKCKKKSVS